MRIILARHGNTFNPEDKVSWVGSRNDLPLVPKGISQAQEVAAALRDISLSAIYFAPLARTKHFAEIIAAAVDNAVPMTEDARLTEIDYGEWSGLSDDEVRQRFGEEVLRGWIDKSEWPANCGWSGSAAMVSEEIKEFVSQLVSSHGRDSNVLVVSSNGRLRYFLHLIENEFQKRSMNGSFKVATGKICLLNVAVRGEIELILWNEKPEAITNFFRDKVENLVRG